MKCNKFLVKGVFTAILAFGFVLTACDTDNDNNPTPEELAAKLTTDLDAILAGSATVEGATVKLTGTVGFLGIPRDLTVPAGVTLDVTADGARLGLGEAGRGGLYDATLTVNGTVIAKAGRIGLEDNAKAATINGSGIIRLNSGGNLLSVEGNRNVANKKITLDGITLVGREDNNQALVRVGKGSELVMKSGVITGNGDNGVIVQGGGTYTKQDGTTGTLGGGTFTMEGGTISGNTGGGVYITCDETYGGGTFTMNSPAVAGTSGNIKGNTRSGNVNNVYNDGGTANGTANPNPNNTTNGLLW
jgi:hypothetical protein